MVKRLKVNKNLSRLACAAAVVSLSAMSITVISKPAEAAPSVTDPTFTAFTPSSQTTSFPIGVAHLTDWTITNPNTAVNCVDVAGSPYICGSTYNNGETVSHNPGVSPAGGNAFLSATAVAQTLSQTISGLTVGAVYAITFYQASSDVSGFFDVATTDWLVSLGGAAVASPTMASLAGTGWEQVTVDVTDVTGTLSFLASGSPLGAPPIVFLSDVSIAVPEPASAAVFGLSVLGLLGLYKSRSLWSDAI